MCLLTEVAHASSDEMRVVGDSYVVGNDSFQDEVTFRRQRNLMASEIGAVDER